MRIFVIGVLAAASFGFVATSGVLATPINSIGKAAADTSPLTAIHYTGYYHRHGYWRHRHYRHCWWRHGRRICRW